MFLQLIQREKTPKMKTPKMKTGKTMRMDSWCRSTSVRARNKVVHPVCNKQPIPYSRLLIWKRKETSSIRMENQIQIQIPIPKSK